MSDALVLAVIAGIPAALVLCVVYLADFFKKKPSRYYGTFYYKD